MDKITHEDIVTYIQEMDKACIRVNGKDFLTAAKNIEEAFDYLISENQMLMDRLHRIEADRFQ